ncbi:MAG: hypothetical protein HY544_03710 [Candidatus Diapherotrites archaeon]|uniref:A-type ATP synthase subunit E n=1 Tax=Candidatus Iainarchaeum sp. TaxID=3101447 RepID=A0A8T3YK12_9ARCH|nr:hypothetical protein [Candidatus Diapherotrites archaeon]
MGMENLRKSLMQEAQAEARKISAEAEKQAEKAIAEAKEKARAIIAGARQAAKESSEAQKAERLSAAQLKARKIVTEAKNRKTEEALAMAWKEFSAIPESKGYEAFMKKAITGAEREFAGKAVVRVREEDMKMAKRLSKGVSPEPARISGGAIVSSPDGKVSVDCSLEAMFEQKKEDIRKTIYLEMFRK